MTTETHTAGYPPLASTLVAPARKCAGRLYTPWFRARPRITVGQWASPLSANLRSGSSHWSASPGRALHLLLSFTTQRKRRAARRTAALPHGVLCCCDEEGTVSASGLIHVSKRNTEQQLKDGFGLKP